MDSITKLRITNYEFMTEEFAQRLEACREIYLKYGGKNHELIEKEMRELGYRDFHRRNLYRRFERGTHTPGWPETYGWDALVKMQNEAGGNASVNERADADGAPFDDSGSPGEGTLVNTRVSARIALPDFDDFKNWLKETWPGMTWEWKHQVYIYKRLRRVWNGDCKRLMIFMPPRHGKSELVTVRFPAWCLKHDPSMNIIIGSYNQKLANRFSRKIRNALADDAFLSGGMEEKRRTGEKAKRGKGEEEKRGTGEAGDHNPHEQDVCRNNISPSPLPLFSFSPSRQKNTEAEWETTQGGGVKAVGVGAGVTGYGAQLIIVDDPVKSRAEAESETFRERVWDWFNDDLYTRLEPDGKIILIQTRWHEDDLAGRLLREAAEEGGEHWDVISLPALAEQVEEERSEGVEETCEGSLSPPLLNSSTPLLPDPLGRAPGEALCPERFNEEKLDRIRRKLGSYSFAALYQQQPVPAEGGLFKRAWFRIVNAAPPNLKWKRGYDLGISKSANADYTASLKVAYDRDGSLYIDGGFRRRIEYPEQRRYILGRIEAEPDTEHGIELSANGNAVVQDLRSEKRTRGRPLRGVKVKGDKITRALPWIALAEEGKVFLVRGPWNTEFIDEAASFPSGTHDDQIDAVSIAVRMHRETRGRLYTF